MPVVAIRNGQQPVFGRINYDYKGRYLVEANLRYDGSSRFYAINVGIGSLLSL